MTLILETERTHLREFRLTDAEAMWSLNSDPEVLKYTGDPPFDSIDGAKKFLENYDQYQLHGFGRWAVILKENQEFIGWCGLKRHPEGFVDLGYRYTHAHWNKGIATETTLPTLRIGFERFGIDEIIGRVDEHNLASVRVLEKLGMVYWKTDICKGVSGIKFFKIGKAAFLAQHG